MRSHKVKFSGFILGFNIAYQAKRSFFDVKTLTPQILSFIQTLFSENLIQFFFFFRHPRLDRRVVRLFFRYGVNQKLLFKKIQLHRKINCFSEKAFSLWLKRKGSLAFPMLFIEHSHRRILTDRRLLYIRLLYPDIRYLGGKILASILP
jgi:hypothetical protein